MKISTERHTMIAVVVWRYNGEIGLCITCAVPLIVSDTIHIIDLLKPTVYYMCHQIRYSKILHADYNAFSCSVWLSVETVPFALYIINRLVLITQVESVYYTVRTEFLYKTYVSSLTLRRLMSYIYAAPILDVSRSHTTTQHSR